MTTFSSPTTSSCALRWSFPAESAVDRPIGGARPSLECPDALNGEVKQVQRILQWLLGVQVHLGKHFVLSVGVAPGFLVSLDARARIGERGIAALAGEVPNRAEQGLHAVGSNLRRF